MGLDIEDVWRMAVLESRRREKMVVFRCNLLQSSMPLYIGCLKEDPFERMQWPTRTETLL